MRELISRLQAEISKVISGYDTVQEKIIIALLADGHVLMESLPGLAKTTLIAAFQAAISDSQKARIQMTPDLKPTDIVGNRIYNPRESRFEIVPGPLHQANLLLVDEINRGTPKTQSALLEAMQERKLTIAGQEYELADFFLVLATMNPIEQEGTYPLPEAQLDRFAFKLTLDYVSRADELKILTNTSVHGRKPEASISPVLSCQDLLELRSQILRGVTVSQAALEYMVDIVRATRPGDVSFKRYCRELEGKVAVGASPRAQIWLRRTAQVRAFMQGRDYVTPDDVKYLAPDVLRHRIILTQEAALEANFTPDAVVRVILSQVPVVPHKTKAH